MGRHEQAVAEIKIAQELDPVSPLMLAIGGEVCNYAGRYDEAIEQCLKAIEIDPNFGLAHGNLSGAYRRKGMYKESITEAEKSVGLYGSTFDSLILQVRVYAVAGARAKALAILNQAAQRSNRPEFDTWEMAIVCAFLARRTERWIGWKQLTTNGTPTWYS